MAVLTFPLSHATFWLRLPIARETFEIASAVETSRTRGGEILTADLGASLWSGKIELGPMTQAEARAITGVSTRLPAVRKSSARTTGAFTEWRATGATTSRAAKAASPHSTPPQNTISGWHSARSPSTTISARLPGAIWPRSLSPKASAADRLAAR